MLLKKILILFTPLVCLSHGIYAQMGIGTNNPDPSAQLHILSTNKGLLVPAMGLANRPASPATGLLIYQTDNTPGFYYNSGTSAASVWERLGGNNTNTAVAFNASGTVTVTDPAGTQTSAGKSWLAGGNNYGTSGTPYTFGTISNDPVDFISNNIVRARISNTGEFHVGLASAPLTGGFMNVKGNSSYPYSVNGYTTGNGAAVYGIRQAGAIGTFGAVQGETDATIGANNSGVLGVAAASTHRGVTGQKPSGGTGWGGLFLNDLGYSGFFGVASDMNVKKNVKKISNVLEKLLQLRGTTFQYSEPYASVLGGDEVNFGFIAQEVEAIFPEMVKEKCFTSSQSRYLKTAGPEINIKCLSTVSLIPVLVEGIKEQQKIIEEQNKKLEDLERRLIKLENK